MTVESFVSAPSNESFHAASGYKGREQQTIFQHLTSYIKNSIPSSGYSQYRFNKSRFNFFLSQTSVTSCFVQAPVLAPTMQKHVMR